MGAALAQRYGRALRQAKDQRCLDVLANNVGARACQVHPQSKAVLAIYKSRDAGIDSDSPWTTSCETHGSMIGSATLALARAAMLVPEWCEECAPLLSDALG